LIDLHFHCLPGIDDGPDDWEEAMALCRLAAAEGTTRLVATPHVLRNDWINDDPALRDHLIFKLNTLLGGEPSVLAGCEYFLSADAIELVERGRRSPLTFLNRTRYLLLEFSPEEMFTTAESIFYEFSLLHVTPVLAHPERSRLFASQPEKLARLVELGALVQITAGSLLGDFGNGPLVACEEFFGRNLVHFVASDAHSVDYRPPRLKAARQHVRRRWGEDVEFGIFEANPEALLRSESIAPSPGLAMRNGRVLEQRGMTPRSLTRWPSDDL
jgi:protein-tyrosine phosphatase